MPLGLAVAMPSMKLSREEERDLQQLMHQEQLSREDALEVMEHLQELVDAAGEETKAKAKGKAKAAEVGEDEAPAPTGKTKAKAQKAAEAGGGDEVVAPKGKTKAKAQKAAEAGGDEAAAPKGKKAKAQKAAEDEGDEVVKPKGKTKAKAQKAAEAGGDEVVAPKGKKAKAQKAAEDEGDEVVEPKGKTRAKAQKAAEAEGDEVVAPTGKKAKAQKAAEDEGDEVVAPTGKAKAKAQEEDVEPAPKKSKKGEKASGSAPSQPKTKAAPEKGDELLEELFGEDKEKAFASSASEDESATQEATAEEIHALTAAPAKALAKDSPAARTKAVLEKNQANKLSLKRGKSKVFALSELPAIEDKVDPDDSADTQPVCTSSAVVLARS